MNWYDDEIAGPMGYRYCVLFDCARDALKAWPHGVALPGNICRSVYQARPDALLEEVDQNTGLAKCTPVHLYGYQSPAGEGYKLTLDPLMTGWVRCLKTQSAIISFGLKKMVSIGYGGALLTQDLSLADEMEQKSRWNTDFNDLLRHHLSRLKEDRLARFDTIDLWDRYLGDSLMRVPAEQVMPWRVMRRASSSLERWSIVKALRLGGFAVGTNYPPLEGKNEWGDRVLNFPCSSDIPERAIIDTCEIIKRVIDG